MALRAFWHSTVDILHESDNPDQIKKMFDDKICTYVSANSGDAYSHLRIQRENMQLQ